MRGSNKLPSPIAGARRWASDRGGHGSKRGGSLPRGWHNWALGLLCLIVVVAAITAVGSSSADSAASQRTATVERGVVQSTVSGNGSLEAAQQVELNFGTSGEVTEIDVEAGQKVGKGEVLARIDSSSARASLAAAEAQLSEAEETLEAASGDEEVSASYEGGATTVLASYESGSTAVSSADGTEPAAEPAPSEGKEDAEGKSETETTKPSKPEGKGEPSGESGGKGAQPESSAKDEGEGGEEAPSAAPTTPSEATPSEAESSSPAGTTVSVATAEAKLRQAQLSVKSARQEVRETALRAPISGTIASVSGSVGETVSGEGSAAGGDSGAESGSGGSGGLGADTSSGSSGGSGSSSAFIVLSQLGRLKMEVSFSESDIGKVKVGQPATVSVSSMEGTELAGRVTKVDVLPSEGSSSGVVEYPATIALTQSAKGVRAGMSASAEVVVEQASNTLAVTSEAISYGPGGGNVTVLEVDKEVERVVTTGLKGDETTQILSGVTGGETVVLPEITPAAGGEGPAGEGGAFPGGGSLPTFGGGGPPGGFPGAP